jgi:amidase
MGGKTRHEDILEATIGEIHHMMAAGEITCRSLIEFYQKRIEAYDQQGPKLKSIIQINPKALEFADQLDEKFKESGLVGPLHGIPVLLKDNILTKGFETTAGSESLRGFIPKEDAYSVKKLIEAGAIIFAKTNLHEFALHGETVSSVGGQTLNPYDLTRTPGGSSGGTAAAVAANFGMVGLGTDTVTSVRTPASACSLVGLRPTTGLISRHGVIPFSSTQDSIGPMTRTMEDAVKILDVLTGYDPEDPITAWALRNKQESYLAHLNIEGLRGKRIGILKTFLGKTEEHQAVDEVMYRRFEEMRNHGAIMVEVEEEIDAPSLGEEVSVHYHELKRDLNKFLGDLGDQVEVNSLSDIIASGKYHKDIEEALKHAEEYTGESKAYYESLVKRQQLRDMVMELLAKYDLDAAVYPLQKIPVVKIGEKADDQNGAISSIAGFPSIVLCGGYTDSTEDAPGGVPVGIEFMTRPWDEGTLIEIAFGFEEFTKCRKPPYATPPLDEEQ